MDRTNSTTKERKDTILKKVGSVGTRFKRKRDEGCYRGEGAVAAEKDKTERGTHGNSQGEHFPKIIALENKKGSVL